jgi:coenzyme F420-reducing hydrogenase gamma subunit
MVREKCGFLVSIGACATAGGIQALRNMVVHDAWRRAVYAHPEYIRSLDTSTPIASHVKVDYELWGCPVDSKQLLQSIQAWLLGGKPEPVYDSVCTECKQKNNTCVMVAQQRPCLGPVTRAGCGALCPSMNRDCYGCFGPAHLTNTAALSSQFESYGIAKKDIALRFLGINNQAEAFKSIGLRYKDSDEQ